MGDEGATLAPTSEPKRRFSYFCTHWNPNLCLGISPGHADPSTGLYVQLKPYSRNFFKGQDQKKMRWDVISHDNLNATEVYQGYLRLEAEYPTLCIQGKRPRNSNLFLELCEATTTRWVHDRELGVIRMADNLAMCMTVAQCVRRTDPARSCLPTINTPERNARAFVEGSVVHAMPCFDQGPAYASSHPAQLFSREIDCVAGCSPEDQNNGKCDEICNNPACAFDKGECIDSLAPTPAPTSDVEIFTIAPTDPPSFGTDINDGMNPNLDVPNLWWLILLLFCCLASAAALFRNKKKRRLNRSAAEEGLFLNGGDASIVPNSTPPSKSARVIDAADDEDDADARFKTASAVALNQLRYHSRAASSSASSVQVNGDSVKKKRPDTSSNDRKYNFDEVGLV